MRPTFPRSHRPIACRARTESRPRQGPAPVCGAAHRWRGLLGAGALALICLAGLAAHPPLAVAQADLSLSRPTDAAIAKLSQSIVKLQAFVPPEARSASRLGTKREGSGVVVDNNGLIVTVGYLISDAMAIEITDHAGRHHRANVVAFDQASGLGLVRLTEPTKLPALPLGDSTALRERHPVIVAAAGGAEQVQPALVVSRREFAGSWEYLLDRAIYTAPPLAQFGGAALIGGDGKLLGIGSLILEAVLPNQALPGNVFVPVDLLVPLLRDVANGGKPRTVARPWLGMNADETQGGMLIVGNVTRDGPARKAGIERGDVLLSVAGQRIRGLADFYRKVWGLGAPGVDVRLDVMQRDGFRGITVKSDDRARFMKLEQTY